VNPKEKKGQSFFTFSDSRVTCHVRKIANTSCFIAETTTIPEEIRVETLVGHFFFH
jgi:hypothetical protein